MRDIMNNPYAQEHIERNAIFDRSAGNMSIAADEARMMEARGSIRCPQRHAAWYKATVGAYVCPDCGAVRAGRGQWTEARR